MHRFAWILRLWNRIDSAVVLFELAGKPTVIKSVMAVELRSC